MNEHSVAETGLALAAVGFGHIPMGIGSGQNQSYHFSPYSGFWCMIPEVLGPDFKQVAW